MENDIERLRGSVRRYREEIETIGGGGSASALDQRARDQRSWEENGEEWEAESSREVNSQTTTRSNGLQRWIDRQRERREAGASSLEAQVRRGNSASEASVGQREDSNTERIGITSPAATGQVEMERVLRAARQALSTAVAFAER